MAGRFIKLYDKILEWEWHDSPSTMALFVYLLLKANYKDIEYRGGVIKRGQLLTSLSKISTNTGLTIQQTKTALQHLISTGEVTNESSRQSRIITIVKYDEYQNITNKSTNDQQTINKRPNNQTTNDLTTSIEYIEDIEKIEKTEHNTPPSREAGSLEQDFEDFWKEYPKKVAKQDALKSWKKLKPSGKLFSDIMIALAKWKMSESWNRDEGKYIPYPASWLNGRRWEDEVPSSRPAPKERPAKTVIAQQYTQRDYIGTQDEAMQAMLAMMRGGDDDV